MIKKFPRTFLVGFIMLLLFGCQSQAASSNINTLTGLEVATQDSTATPVVNNSVRKLTIETLPSLVIGENWSNIAEQAQKQGYKVIVDSPNVSNTILVQRGEIDAGVNIGIKDGKAVSLGFSIRLAGQDELRTGIPAKYWKTINPQTFLNEYGTPTEIRSITTWTGSGPVVGLTMFWEQVNIAITYTLLPMSQISNANRILSICVIPQEAIISKLWIVQDSVKDTVLKDINSGIDPYEKKLESGMFTNASTLDDVRDAILRGECLQSPLAFWGY